MSIEEETPGEFIQMELIDRGRKGWKCLEQLAMKRRIKHIHDHILWVVIIPDVKQLGGDGCLLAFTDVEHLVSQHIRGLRSWRKAEEEPFSRLKQDKRAVCLTRLNSFTKIMKVPTYSMKKLFVRDMVGHNDRGYSMPLDSRGFSSHFKTTVLIQCNPQVPFVSGFLISWSSWTEPHPLH